MLAPRDTVWSAAHVADEGNEEADSDDGEVLRPAAKPVLMPASLGLSFAVEPGCDRLVATASWGSYLRDHEVDESGRRHGVWQRVPVEVQLIVDLPAIDGAIGPLPLPEWPQVHVEGRVSTTLTGVRLLSLFLVNNQEPPQSNRDAAWLFQAQLAVTAADGGSAFVGRAEALGPSIAPLPIDEQRDLAMLDLQYRDSVEFAVGHGIATQAEPSPADPRRALRIQSVAIGLAEVPRTETPSPAQSPELAGTVLDMRSLALADDDALSDMLRPLPAGYGAWIAGQQARVTAAEADFAGHHDAIEDALDRAHKVHAALQAGVDIILSNPQARAAFRFANHAMWQQRVRSDAIDLRRRQPQLSLAEALAQVDVPGRRSWRPFQLAFLCLNAPSLSDPTHTDRVAEPTVDLLFFPTGGGKTEAYLGLVAFCFAIRRLQGVVASDLGDLDGRDGVAVFMRYTLRALTSQQFERAAGLVAACEVIRRTTPATWGQVPFRLGLWVGAALAPNRRSEAKRAVDDARAGKQVRAGNPLQLSSCPWCGALLELGRDVDAHNDWDRTLVYCPDAEGDCAFTKGNSPTEGIPVVTVDEELYRLLPSFFIATVDKFAQLPWKGPVRMLFGYVSRRCSRHGFRSQSLDEELSEIKEADSHQARGGLPKAITEACLPLRPPDLIIQDELHLITGPLGTLAALYESAVDRLATWRVDGRDVRPKVVASTATIRRAQTQTWNLFHRRLRLFPPPLLDAGDSFFARQMPITADSPGRLYLGICAHGRRLKEVENRVFATVMAAAQGVYQRYGPAADPWMTTVGYFGSVRELAGMKRLSDDELRKRLNRASFYTGLADRRLQQVAEMTSRIPSPEIRLRLDDLRRPFHTDSPSDANHHPPVDLLLATNMISVGLDVPRLGLMVAVGQPKSASEYIQATSRVGRSAAGPGLVLTILNWTRPRDLSHYERFAQFHATYYRQVEPLSVTPFADRALDRGLSAVLVALLRGLNDAWNPAIGASQVDRHDPLVADILGGLLRRGVAVSGKSGLEEGLRQAIDRRLDALAQQQSKSGALLTYERSGKDAVALLRKPEAEAWQLWTCPMSMRSTEPGINLLLDDADPSFGTGGRFRIATPRTTAPEGGISVSAESEDLETDPDEAAAGALGEP